MELPKDKVLVVMAVDDPTPIAFRNLYGPGLWIKVQGCESCKREDAEKCCGNCPHRMAKGCDWHFEVGKYKDKPFRCCIVPVPNITVSRCALVYKCVEGRWKNHYRHVCDRNDILRYEDEEMVTV
jgi:hypothetical protein